MRAAALASLTGQELPPSLHALIRIAGIVYLSGSRLTGQADAIADASALGRLSIGTLTLASARRSCERYGSTSC